MPAITSIEQIRRVGIYAHDYDRPALRGICYQTSARAQVPALRRTPHTRHAFRNNTHIRRASIYARDYGIANMSYAYSYAQRMSDVYRYSE